MHPLLPLVFGLLVADPAGAVTLPSIEGPSACTPEMELANLRELLKDRQDPRGQSQAALLLVQSNDDGAEKIVHQGLRHPDNEEMFLALVASVRIARDRRFCNDLLAVLVSNKPRLRQVVAETLAVLPEPTLVARLGALAGDPKADMRVRQTALWTLGRCGRHQAGGLLVEALTNDSEDLRRVAAGALADLTGQNFGVDPARWQAWWARHKQMTAEQWLQMRLSFQTNRALRLEGELARARAQVLRLHQQVYTRLPLAERFIYVQSLVDQEDPAVRGLAVVWSLELLPANSAGAEPRHAEHQKLLARVLLQLTHDASPEVQRSAVLGLGRLTDPAAGERLHQLLKNGRSLVRAAAARALAQQARGTTSASISSAQARARLKEVIPALQKALEDKALEVVVEAAEALGTLGAPEAGPVLTELLQHPSETIRQTAAQALERMADATLVDGLLKGLDDPSVTVRFSLVGALGRAAGGSAGTSPGRTLSAEQRKRMMLRLEGLLKRDADPGVRSRAATVIGEHAGPGCLPTLWRVVVTGAEGRAQEKAWDAFVEIIARSASVALLRQWDRTIRDAHQGTRRVQLLAGIYAKWDERGDLKEAATAALEALVQAQIDLGKWSAAAPLVQNLLSRGDGGETTHDRCLHWLLEIGELALKEGNRTEALRIVQDARAYLSRGEKLGEAFDRLEKLARKE